MVVMQPAWLAPFLLLTGCGGLVVFEDADAADGSGSSESPTDASGTGPATGSTGSSGGDGGSDAGSSSSSAGGAAPDGACIADDYCSCIAVPTCQVVGDECFCPCDEPCSEPCECDCAGGAFLQCAPGSIRDPGALDVGVWLVGWSDVANHFSWLRFDPDGRLQVLAEGTASDNTPYFPCTGTGSWSFNLAPESVTLDLPPGCTSTSITFELWFPLGMLVPALQVAFLRDNGEGRAIGAWRYPDEMCSPDLASCGDPVMP